ncbi:unnamed protein product [Chondrus crispus]|uniref:BFN domain-containing protein n=1 Tax=Chondrus crispus TaxID=2769 RepID=R7Q4S4_CHOCR|nr:unnamed protein product [Chondrus crispus]CDF32989.1 unnamed protein product [Chondrus crispus]|eukprot:XP_005712792.1 unnamed protein product [Chondrus crispus]
MSAFALPSALPSAVSLSRTRHTLCPRRASPRTPVRRRPPCAQQPSQSPDYGAGFMPESDPDYEEVRVLSFGPTRNDGSLLTLRPVSGGDRAFKMSVTVAQADSIRAALARTRRNRHIPHPSSTPFSEPSAHLPTGRLDYTLMRPATHDLFKDVLDLFGGFVTKAAITHIQDEVFIARVWVRGPFAVTQDEVHIDSRPSDAIAMALRSRAPLYLNKHLLRQWNVSVEAIARDAKHGLCECVTDYPDEVKSTRSIVHELKGSPEHLILAKLRMELDLAVRLERFQEASRLREQIASICPIDRLSDQLKCAIDEERYLDAAKLQDQITLWRARVRMWEKGSINIEDLQGGIEDCGNC